MAEILKSSGNIAYDREWSEHQDPMRYSEILEWLSYSRESYIGSSYYYIRSGSDDPEICWLNITGGSLYFIRIPRSLLRGEGRRSWITVNQGLCNQQNNKAAV